ncbi:MAG: hypothetical protein EOM91_22520, partial [Sphingobacteriia bacterium]|nr:hypothetical protein [Sphingobacteriia bacterium]
MYYFRYWAPENSPHRGRFYVEGGDGEYLCVVNGRPAVRGTSTDLRRVLILRFLHENGIGIGASGIRGMRELGDELVRCRLLLGGRWAAQRANADVDDGYRFLDLPPADLYR